MKTFLIVFLLSFCIPKFSQSQGISSGLVAQYCFSGNADDELGVRHATVHGATLTTDRYGTPNEAYSYNGLYDYIQMPSDIWVAGNFSITGWLYVNTYGYWSRFVEWGNGIDKDNVFFSPCRGGGPQPVFTVHECSSTNRSYGGYTSGVFPTKQWVFVAITLSGDTARIYKDNILWYTYNMAYIPCSVVRTECYFGRSNFSWDKSLDGKIDDVRIYNRAITVAEIDTIFKLIGCGKSHCTATIVATPDTQSVCIGEKINFKVTGGKRYKWSPSSGLDNDTIANPVFSGISSTKYVVKGTDVDGCIGYDSISITVNPLPLITAVPDSSKICEGDTVQLSASGAVTYQWTPAEGLDDATIANPKAIVKSTHLNYTVKGTDANGCSAMDSVSIFSMPNPVIMALPDTILCAGSEIQLWVSGGNKYQWVPSSGLNNDTLSQPKLLIAEGSSLYIVSGKDTNGCIGYDTLNIFGHPLPIIEASQNLISEECRKTVAQLQASGADSFFWLPAVYCDNSLASKTKVTIDQTVLFTVKGTNADGCSAIDTITVIYKGNTIVHVPNAFTPNNDLKNDVIRPIISCDFTLKEFSIYNRWGQQVYTSDNLNASWDGTFNGSPNEMGVYFYLLKGEDYNHKAVMLKGDITLIR